MVVKILEANAVTNHIIMQIDIFTSWDKWYDISFVIQETAGRTFLEWEIRATALGVSGTVLGLKYEG